MQWITHFEMVLAHMCESRQHEAPIEGRAVASRPKDDGNYLTGPIAPYRTVLAGVWAAKYLV